MAAFEFVGLTTASTLSDFGFPVLRVHADDNCVDYLPGDPVCETAGRIVLARDVVVRWLASPGRTAQDIELGRRFLG